MKTTPSSFLLSAAILCGGVLFEPAVDGQQTEVFLKTKANAEKGFAEFQYLLGESYENGMGVKKDEAEAVKWYRKAADQDHAQAQASLGKCYQYGRGAEKDYAEAYAWFNLAAKTEKYAASRRDALGKQMSQEQLVAAQKRTKELRASIDAKPKSGGALGQVADPLLAAGEQALVGSYRLDHVLLAPGKLVVLPNGTPLFAGMGDTPEAAANKGLLNAQQVAVLQRQACTMTILADHSFTITNLPSADLSQTVSVTGRWSIQVYNIFETYGYRIALNCDGSKGTVLHAKFFNADKPDPPILDILYGDGKNDSVMFRFVNPSRLVPSRRSR